ncbi:MAG: TRAP transporter small permease [Desulfocapsaceae bacterium]|nr:TRAP transporter small permease [Desulfocapsaceae bacterium]
MIRLLLSAKQISQIAAWGSGLLLFLASLMIAVEVVLRKAFAVSIGGADELSSYALAISCTWGFSFALFRKSHIRIDVLYTHLPRFFKHALDILANFLLLFYITILCYFASIVVKTSIAKVSTANTPLATPLWIPQSLWLAGLIWFGLTILLTIVGTVFFIVKKDHESAFNLSGISTLSEEIKETTEIHSVNGYTKISGGEAK